MKKILTLAIAACTFSMAANAQETFYPGWNFGAGVGADFVIGQNGRATETALPLFQLTAGYEFTPAFGVRGALSGICTKTNYNADVRKFNHAQFAVEAVLDIANLFEFKSERLLSPYVFAGPAVNLRFNNREVVKQVGRVRPEGVWKYPTWGFEGVAGAGLNIRVNDAVKIFIEGSANLLPDVYESHADSKLCLAVDAFAGVKLTIGQARKKQAALAAAAAAAEAARLAAEQAAEEARLAAEAAKAAADKAAAEKAAEEARIAAEKAAAEALAAAKKAINDACCCLCKSPMFFIGSSYLTPRAEKKLKAAAEVIKANSIAPITITGHADKNTGSTKRNLQVARNRAEIVAGYLVSLGVDATKINIKWAPETDMVSYKVIAHNRTAIISAE